MQLVLPLVMAFPACSLAGEDRLLQLRKPLLLRHLSNTNKHVVLAARFRPRVSPLYLDMSFN